MTEYAVQPMPLGEIFIYPLPSISASMEDLTTTVGSQLVIKDILTYINPIKTGL